jgi:SNF2 family DNA or RNA helicase
VYIRIRGLSSQLDEETSLVTEDIESTCLLKSLPKEILVSNIAPYLRARSLNSLRNTCWYLHKNLSFVVPGLKLRLFNHQINSLNWMRMRECQHVSENDILSNPKLLHLHRTGGDLHRAVTGGATVALLPRQSCNSSNIIRISQEYGHEISRNDSLTSTRTVARGGLLCDDPGLGKTITVLSLILQTIGLTSTTTSHETMSSAEETLTKNRTDEIFDAYWSETMTADFRRPALFKLYRRIQRTDDGVRLFQAGMIPSDSPSSRSEAEIDPISLLLIGKKIEKDAYKDSFWLFKHDVQRCFQ